MKKKDNKSVRAVIELKITPQRNTGFGKIAIFKSILPVKSIKTGLS